MRGDIIQATLYPTLAYSKSKAFVILYGMKKLCFIFAAVMTAATVWWLAACGKDAMNDVSERRSGYFTGGIDGAELNAVSGVRESEYALDGAVGGALVPYTLITLTPVAFDVDAVYTYKAEYGGSVYGGTMIVHPFGASFSAEIPAEFASDFSVEISCAGKTDVAEMHSLVTSEMYAFDRAIDAAKQALGTSATGEIRVRLIKNPIDHTQGVCWHVSFKSADGGDYGVLLDPVTAKVLAKKTA